MCLFDSVLLIVFRSVQELPNLELLNRGKVRDVYAVDEKTILFVATDRISAFDVIMLNVSRRMRKRIAFQP